MKKIRIEFRGGGSTEFRVEAPNPPTYRELLVLARGLPEFFDKDYLQREGRFAAVEIEFTGKAPFGFSAAIEGGIEMWQIRLVADEFYLAAQHIFVTRQNVALAAAAQKQIIVPRPQVVRGRG